MKLTIIYDNTAVREDLQPDPGFSALVEVEGAPKILFDTGTVGEILMRNMKRLQILPEKIEEVFISHAHLDHTGGIPQFLAENKNARFYVPPSFSGPEGREITVIDKPVKIHENVFSTGEIDGIEQSMGVITAKGIVLVVGCSHPDMAHILDTARQFGNIYGIIGGIHSFSKFNLFRDLEIICPTHCTRHKNELKSLYPDKYIEGGAGRIINI